MFDQLSSLNTSRSSWRVKVRVTRMWPSGSNGNEVIKGYNLILLDDDNCHIHAYVYADNWKNMTTTIEEGGLYIISNFFTKEALGTLRPVSSKIIINFSPSTSVEKIKEDDFMIPFHKFEFVDLSELFTIANSYADPENPEYSADVIGAVEDFERVTVIKTMYGDRNIVRFRITDGRHSHKVTVWGKLAISTDAMFSERSERPLIAILASTKLKIFKKSVQIITIPSSKVYFNLDTDILTSMRERLHADGFIAAEKILSSQSECLSPAAPVVETISLKELGEKTSTDMLEKNFLCFVKITDVEEIANWWTYSDYDNESLQLDDKIKYRIIVVAEDATAEYNFILMDSAVQCLVGKTASELLSENKVCQYSILYPECLRQIIGKEVTLKIEINDGNILIKSKIFTATDAYDYFESSSSSFTTNTGSSSYSSPSGENMID